MQGDAKLHYLSGDVQRPLPGIGLTILLGGLNAMLISYYSVGAREYFKTTFGFQNRKIIIYEPVTPEVNLRNSISYKSLLGVYIKYVRKTLVRGVYVNHILKPGHSARGTNKLRF